MSVRKTDTDSSVNADPRRVAPRRGSKPVTSSLVNADPRLVAPRRGQKSRLLSKDDLWSKGAVNPAQASQSLIGAVNPVHTSSAKEIFELTSVSKMARVGATVL